jgi:hypothetical protein
VAIGEKSGTNDIHTLARVRVSVPIAALKWVALAAPTEGLKEVLRQLAVLQASSSTETL